MPRIALERESGLPTLQPCRSVPCQGRAAIRHDPRSIFVEPVSFPMTILRDGLVDSFFHLI
ncbi:hypothetical protein ASF57_17575 [Methylobacterium sp. Leaf117]|nr:hypothetical protein ASF57_17575 [Methylobacterium sp. Leaf117]